MNTSPKVPRVVCAAIRKEGSTICGVRHFDELMIMQILASGEPIDWRDADQGFVDRDYRFLTREQAWEAARLNGQILYALDWCVGSLHSEHLY